MQLSSLVRTGTISKWFATNPTPNQHDPVLGEKLYRGKRAKGSTAGNSPLLTRVQATEMNFEAPVPTDFADAMRQIPSS